MIAVPQFLVDLVQPWAHFYSDSKVAPSLVTFVHVGGLLLAGGLAISFDRATLRVNPADDAARSRHLTELAAVHRTVLVGLTLIIISGVFLFASDVEAHWASWIYWTKMGLIVVLLANGFRMTRAEQALAVAKPEGIEAGWRSLRGAAVVSLALWFIVALLGVMLVNLA